ncbi:hypothetical protein [Bradyrhizobium canariense]|uniref:Uncharacterized protein n=1 Tax=Bradyrhizobium canariense TaxID=255045 RepID=A0A1X3H2K1_9BRAD|nr:hypothetical protein [Bradyrhizobium canariense]OSI67648.1 hypothetical protein BSZ22_24485 [Bradyrhizobium canariense]OSI77487.1 hypothetical protein BSZ23_22545 [Bradyrhizobium canariense]OSI88573.1 hypothetical protein BSZ25_24015 [Bradyrhizobium canariense]OSJ00966.1 hypothetical protein BSZ16_22685 [Bradyrhizobium canariense]OSJ05609.1 hypothetical protein BSZ18_25960 [Bradyrhizobium canariense]
MSQVFKPFDLKLLNRPHMITLTITSESGDTFVVRFQSKTGQSADGSPMWQDSEVTKAVGRSQRYGLDGNFRLVIEAPSDPDKADG